MREIAATGPRPPRPIGAHVTRHRRSGYELRRPSGHPGLTCSTPSVTCLLIRDGFGGGRDGTRQRGGGGGGWACRGYTHTQQLMTRTTKTTTTTIPTTAQSTPSPSTPPQTAAAAAAAAAAATSSFGQVGLLFITWTVICLW